MIRLLVAISLAILSALFFFIYHEQYFKWRGCFNELGRCFDAGTGVVYLEQSGAIWLSLAVIFLLIAAYQFWRGISLPK